MKKYFTLAIMLLSSMFAMAQSSIIVKFTAEDQNGNYFQLDAVNVTSISQSWNQTLAYPDTILILNYIDGIGEQSSDGGILQNRPNPFHGTTETTLNLVEDGQTTVQLFDMKGAVLAEYEANLTQGEHTIKVCLAEPQMALLRVNTAKQSYVAKLLNIGNGGENRIEISNSNKIETKATKAVGAGPFAPGDVLSYVGIKMQGSDMVMSNNTVTQAQYADDVITFVFNVETPEVPEGAINGLFSVSDTTKVYFSKGNLQYQASTQTWRFAENQWDYVGCQNPIISGIAGGTVSGSDNANISSTYSGWIDLFGFATSGYSHGAIAYQPYSTSENNSDYYAYGNASYNLYDQTGKADWGYNAIINGGNSVNLWKTLTKEEWEYLLNTRVTASNILYAKATVNGVSGLILFPDDWNSSYYTLSSANTVNAEFSVNTVTLIEWISGLESYGAIFLPAAGIRRGTSLGYVGTDGHYWSSSLDDLENAYMLGFTDSNLDMRSYYRCGGRSVRLVQDAN